MIEQTLNLPEELWYTSAEGDLVKHLPLSAYLLYIAKVLGNTKSSLSQQVSLTDNLGEQLADVQDEVDQPIPDLVMTLPDIMGDSEEHLIEDVVTQVGGLLINIRNAGGTPGQILDAVAAEPNNLGNYPALSQQTTLRELTGWIDNPSTLAETVNNLWITVLDMRGPVSEEIIQPESCAGLIVDFGASLNSNTRVITVQFFGHSTVPNDYVQLSDPPSTIKIEDSYGNVHYAEVDIVDSVRNNNSVQIYIDNTPLNPNADFKVFAKYVLTKNSTVCSGTVSHTLVNNINRCPTVQITPRDTRADFVVNQATDAPTTYRFVVSRVPHMDDETGDPQVWERTYTNMLGAFTDSITPITAGRTYTLQISVEIGPDTYTQCAPINFTTIGNPES